MKTRIGFVSNSSSSSFILAFKDMSLEQVKDRLLESLKVPKDSPLYGIASEISYCFVNQLEGDGSVKKFIKNQGYSNLKEFLEENSDEFLVKAIKNDMKIYTGGISDQDGGVEFMLCDTEFNINLPNLIVHKEAGY